MTRFNKTYASSSEIPNRRWSRVLTQMCWGQPLLTNCCRSMDRLRWSYPGLPQSLRDPRAEKLCRELAIPMHSCHLLRSNQWPSEGRSWVTLSASESKRKTGSTQRNKKRNRKSNYRTEGRHHSRGRSSADVLSSVSLAPTIVLQRRKHFYRALRKHQSSNQAKARLMCSGLSSMMRRMSTGMLHSYSWENMQNCGVTSLVSMLMLDTRFCRLMIGAVSRG